MDVLDILDELEAEIKASPYVPISGARAVELETLQRLVQRLRDVSRADARPAEEPPEQVVARAQNLARLEVIAAHREAEQILDGARINTLATERANEIVAQGQTYARQVVSKAYTYAASRYQEGQQQLQRATKHVREARKAMMEESKVAKSWATAERTAGVTGGKEKKPSLASRATLGALSVAARLARRT